MAVSNISFGVLAAIVVMICAIFMPLAHGQSSAPAPSPTSDGESIPSSCQLLSLTYKWMDRYEIARLTREKKKKKSFVKYCQFESCFVELGFFCFFFF
jgi:hypothetical protein